MAGSPAPAGGHPARVCVFDLYGTLLDLDSAVGRLAPAVQDPVAFGQAWRAKQLEYSWTRTLMGRWADFGAVTEAALDWCLAEAGLDDASARDALLASYRELAAYPDAAPALRALRDRGLRCGVLTNGTMPMARAALDRAGLGDLIDPLISADGVGAFKPHPSVYAFALERLGRRPGEVLFVSSNAWDAAGAVAAGLAVVWLNRRGRPAEYGLGGAAVELRSLHELPDALAGSAASAQA